MTNFEFYKDTILEKINHNQNIAVVRNAPANNCIKKCLFTECKNCLFNDLKKTCTKSRYEWFYEEHKETFTLTEREWHFLKVLQHGEIYRDTLGNIFWKSSENKKECMLTYELHKGLFSFCKPDCTRFSVEEMLTWEIGEKVDNINNINKKYELLKDDFIEILGRKLYRIRALKNFGKVLAGELGGYIESEKNLSQEGNAWVYDDARICDDAIVCDNAIVMNNAWVYGNAKVSDHAVVRNDAIVYNYAQILGNAQLCERSYVFDNAIVCDNAHMYGDSRACNNAQISGHATISSHAWVYGDAKVFGSAQLSGHASVSGNAQVCGTVRISGEASLSGDIYIQEMTDYFVIGPIGSRDEYTTFALNLKGEIIVICGCFKGNIKEFENKVHEVHSGTRYEDDYMLAIAFAKRKIKYRSL